MNNNRFIRALAFGICCVSFNCVLPPTVAGAQLNSVDGAPSTLQNRSVLNVGSEMYSSVDAVAIIVASRILDPSSQVKLSTDWLKPIAAEATRADSNKKALEDWPGDVARVLFVTLVWSEASRLNLFAPSPKDLSEAAARLSSGWSAAVRELGVSEPLRTQVLALTGERMTRIADMQLRSQTFARVRGNIERNANLLTLGWYWHQLPGGGTKKE